MIATTFTIHGRVQKVMFRDFVQRKARWLGLSGTVQNRLDGTVFVYVEGDEESVKKLEQKLHKGSIFSRVDKVVAGEKVTPLNCQGFQIVYS